MKSWLGLALFVATAGITAAPVHAQKGPALADVLQAAADYLVDYSQKLGAVEAEEALTQRETSGGSFGTGRTWRAEVVLLGFGNGDIEVFRDVFEVESSKARERDSRLLKIFQEDPSQGLREGRKLTADAGRLALVPAMTAFNTPTLALAFLRLENQSRSTFKLDGVRTMNGAQVAILKFNEQRKPHLLQGTEDGATQGRFWVATSSGTVRQTELLFTSRGLDVRSTVIYAADSKLGLWLPVSLNASYNLTGAGSGSATVVGQGYDNLAYGSRQTVESQVRYSKFQQTSVDLKGLGK